MASLYKEEHMQIGKFTTNSNFNTKTKINTGTDRKKNMSDSISTNRFDKVILSQNKGSENVIENYNEQRKSIPVNQSNIIASTDFMIDKGTASHTTVFINRSAYDQILNVTTFGDKKWEEMGVDDDKRWVVVNGQRFECEHTPEEKALRKRLQKTLVDYMIEADQKKADKKYNGKDKPKGNIEALTNNKEVMGLLGEIFHVGTPEEILKKIS